MPSGPPFGRSTQGLLRESVYYSSNSRPVRCDSPWSSHFDSGSLTGPLGGEEGRPDGAWQSPNWPGRATLPVHLRVHRASRTRLWLSLKPRATLGSPGATRVYVEFSKTGLCGAIPRTRAISNFRHRVKQQSAKMTSHIFPELALGLHLVPGRPEHGTTQLLNLIHQEGQHHQQGRHPPTGSARRVRSCVPGDILGFSRC